MTSVSIRGRFFSWIFSIYKRENFDKNVAGSTADILRPGTDIVAAGYAMYGASTELVITYDKASGVERWTCPAAPGQQNVSSVQCTSRIPAQSRAARQQDGQSRARGECENPTPPKGRESGYDHEPLSTGGPHSQGGPLEP